MRPAPISPKGNGYMTQASENILDKQMEVLKYPNPLLKKKAEPVEVFDAELADLVDRMFATMRINDGVGLAAPQVGVSKRLAVIEYGDKSWVLINPRIVEQDGEQEDEEGCLSFPGIYAPVKRPMRVKVEAYDKKGELHTHEVEGFAARAFVHEIEHLDGKLFIDMLSALKRGAIKKKMQKHGDGGTQKKARSKKNDGQ